MTATLTLGGATKAVTVPIQDTVSDSVGLKKAEGLSQKILGHLLSGDESRGFPKEWFTGLSPREIPGGVARAVMDFRDLNSGATRSTLKMLSLILSNCKGLSDKVAIQIEYAVSMWTGLFEHWEVLDAVTNRRVANQKVAVVQFCLVDRPIRFVGLQSRLLPIGITQINAMEPSGWYENAKLRFRSYGLDWSMGARKVVANKQTFQEVRDCDSVPDPDNWYSLLGGPPRRAFIAHTILGCMRAMEAYREWNELYQSLIGNTKRGQRFRDLQKMPEFAEAFSDLDWLGLMFSLTGRQAQQGRMRLGSALPSIGLRLPKPVTAIFTSKVPESLYTKLDNEGVDCLEVGGCTYIPSRCVGPELRTVDNWRGDFLDFSDMVDENIREDQVRLGYLKDGVEIPVWRPSVEGMTVHVQPISGDPFDVLLPEWQQNSVRGLVPQVSPLSTYDDEYSPTDELRLTTEDWKLEISRWDHKEKKFYD